MDNMVLQRQSEVALWGGATPNSRVTIKCGWSEKEFETRADRSGKWKIEVATPPKGGPYTIEISDGEPVILKNILIGEVWVCSGQSNMEMPMRGFTNQPVYGASEAMIAATGKNNVRMFTVKRTKSPQPLDDCEGSWEVQSPNSVAATSATAYYFANNLSALLDCPVGIIVSSWGGSCILSWMPKSSILNVVDEEGFDSIRSKDGYEAKTPVELYNAMLHPIVNYTARGFIWYQGETNIGQSNIYPQLQQEMVRTWRSNWGDVENKMPFFFAEIAPWHYGDSEGVVRAHFVEGQKRAAEITPNSYMIATADVGNELCIHPAQKKEVGERFALSAYKNCYGLTYEEVDFPEIDRFEFEDGKAYVHFKGYMGIGASGGTFGDPIVGFELAGDDGVFHSAKAVVNEHSPVVVVESKEVEQPKEVRYAFRNYIKANLVNIYGVALPTFRSDNFEESFP